MSFVDVIVPCYRYACFLRECVESVLTQSLRDVRLLIIDDASPDNTADVAADLVRADPRVTFFRHSQNWGHIETYNEGINWADSDYMLILSADDYLLPGALKRAVDLMGTHPDVGFTFGKAVDLTVGGMQTDTVANAAVTSVVHDTSWSLLDGQEFFRLIQSFQSSNIVRAPTAIVRTELQKRLGGYRLELPHTGDLEMWLRLAAHADVGVIRDYQAVYRFHGDNMHRGYHRASHLPDLEQRKAAFDYVAQNCSGVLANSHDVHRNLLAPLALEAVRCASGAFNAGERELALQLAAFAIAAHPEIRRTLPWVVLGCKQFLGVRLWSTFQPSVIQLRSFLRFFRSMTRYSD